MYVLDIPEIYSIDWLIDARFMCFVLLREDELFLGPCWQCLPALVVVQRQGEGGAHSEDQFEMFALLCQRKAKVHALGF